MVVKNGWVMDEANVPPLTKWTLQFVCIWRVLGSVLSRICYMGGGGNRFLREFLTSPPPLKWHNEIERWCWAYHFQPCPPLQSPSWQIWGERSSHQGPEYQCLEWGSGRWRNGNALWPPHHLPSPHAGSTFPVIEHQGTLPIVKI